MTQFITGAPIWVWPLLLLLVVVGLRARKRRMAPVALIYLLPLLGVMTLRSIAVMPAGLWIWLVFGTGYGAGILLGHHLQGRWLLGREGNRIDLAGETVTLATMMGVFWANFVGGTFQAVAPDVYANPAFQGAFAALLALCAGIFAGRALRVWRNV